MRNLIAHEWFTVTSKFPDDEVVCRGATNIPKLAKFKVYSLQE